MNKLVKGSFVRNGYNPRLIGQVMGFKIVRHKLVPIVKYGHELILDTSPVELASKYKRKLVK